jgi:hypothetical protein
MVKLGEFEFHHLALFRQKKSVITLPCGAGAGGADADLAQDTGSHREKQVCEGCPGSSSHGQDRLVTIMVERGLSVLGVSLDYGDAEAEGVTTH